MQNNPNSGESCFRQTAYSLHYKLKSPSRAEKLAHIDFIMSGLNQKKQVTSVSLDIKYKGKKKSDAWQWLEFKNPQGKMGWLYQRADFIVFERAKDFILVNRKNLVKWVNVNNKIRHDLPFVTNSWDAKYRLFRRGSKKESITQIKTSDILQIHGTQIWNKKCDETTSAK